MADSAQKEKSNIREKVAKGVKPKPRRNQFLISLHKVLEKKEYEPAMCWDTDGKTFILKDPEVIANRILTEEFSGMKFSSFIRQLSYYGFKRISQRTSAKVYFHEQFRRDGTRDNLKQIKRNHKDISSIDNIFLEATSTHEETNAVAESMENKIAYLQAELNKMRAENMALRSCIRNLQETKIEYEQQQREQYIQSDFSELNNENAASGFYQTFFEPQIYSNAISNDESAFPSTNSNFIEVYQPECRGLKPYFAGKLQSGSTGPYEGYSPILDSDEENNLFKPIHEKSAEDFWRIDMPTENDW